MTAREKLDEAKFFLSKLRQFSEFDSEGEIPQDDFKYYASACVWALYGSYDHLLYDYARKFWPKLGTDDYLTRDNLKLVAKATENKEAKEFLKWYNKALGRIQENKDAMTIIKVRKVEAHRAQTQYYFINDFTVSLHDAVTASGAITMATYYEPWMPKPIEIGSIPNVPPVVPIPSSMTTVKRIGHFSDYPDKSVDKVIEDALILLDQIVSEAETKFGTPQAN